MSGILWALFGNDDDGIYGERGGEPGFDPRVESARLIQPPLWRAVRWWLRNPFHNLFFHVWRWPGGPFLSVKGCFYIGFRPNPDWPERDGVFGAALFRGYGE